MKPKPADEKENLILKNLSAEVFGKLDAHLKEIEMPLGKYLYTPFQEIDYVYFPDTSVISIVTMLESGNGVESGIIGREGVLGASAAFAEDVSTFEATVQLAGTGRRLKTRAFTEVFDLEKEFRDLILGFVYGFIAQISRNSACLCYHGIEKRLARWLLMFDDRKGASRMVLTQDFLAQMLGVRRPSVSVCAKKLQDAGLIIYKRGIIEVLDRPRLKLSACECYREMNRALEKAL